MMPSKLREKSVGAYFLLASTVLALAATVLYLIFGISSGTFTGSIFVLALIATLLSAAALFYSGFLADYIPAAATALFTASLVLLIENSIDDVTAFFVGMGDYFGNADNVGFRVAVAVAMLAAIVLTIAGAFLRQGNKQD